MASTGRAGRGGEQERGCRARQHALCPASAPLSNPSLADNSSHPSLGCVFVGGCGANRSRKSTKTQWYFWVPYAHILLIPFLPGTGAAQERNAELVALH